MFLALVVHCLDVPVELADGDAAELEIGAETCAGLDERHWQAAKREVFLRKLFDLCKAVH